MQDTCFRIHGSASSIREQRLQDHPREAPRAVAHLSRSRAGLVRTRDGPDRLRPGRGDRLFLAATTLLMPARYASSCRMASLGPPSAASAGLTSVTPSVKPAPRSCSMRKEARHRGEEPDSRLHGGEAPVRKHCDPRSSGQPLHLTHNGGHNINRCFDVGMNANGDCGRHGSPPRVPCDAAARHQAGSPDVRRLTDEAAMRLIPPTAPTTPWRSGVAPSFSSVPQRKNRSKSTQQRSVGQKCCLQPTSRGGAAMPAVRRVAVRTRPLPSD